MKWGTKEWFAEKVRLQGFDRASSYFGHKKSGYQYLRHSTILGTIDEVISQNNLSNVLDLGAGTGELAGRIKDKHPEVDVLACDFVEELIVEGKKNHQSVRFEINSLPNIPNIEYKPTLVILADVLYYLSKDDQKICIKKLSEALHPRSQLIITSVYSKSYFLPTELQDSLCEYFSFQKLSLIRIPLYGAVMRFALRVATVCDYLLYQDTPANKKVIRVLRKYTSNVVSKFLLGSISIICGAFLSNKSIVVASSYIGDTLLVNAKPAFFISSFSMVKKDAV